MPYITTWKANGVHWEFFGRVTQDEIDEANDQFYADPRFGDIEYYLWDGLGITELDFPIEHLEYTAAADQGSNYTNPDLKGAIVGEKPELRKYLQFYIDSSNELDSTWHNRLFHTKKEAYDWICEFVIPKEREI